MYQHQQPKRFFEKAGVTSLLRALALIPLINGFANIGIVHLHRELRFQKIVIWKLAIALTDLIVSVGLAWYFKNAMALVIGKIAGIMVGLIVSFVIESRKPRFRFDVTEFRELFQFGFWVFMSAILSYTLIRGGDLVIAKLLTEVDLAIYQIAYGIACIPLMEIMRAINSSTFSAFSRIQNDRDRLANAFLRVLALSSFIATLSVIGFFCLSEDFTKMMFRENVHPIAGMMPWLAIWGACRALGTTNSVLFQAIGKPALATVFQFMMLFMFGTLLIPMAIWYGVIGVVYALVIIGLSAQIGRYCLIVIELRIPITKIAERTLIPLAIGAVAWLATWSILSTLPANAHTARMVVGMVIVISSYASLTVYTDRKLSFGITQFISSHFLRSGKFNLMRS